MQFFLNALEIFADIVAWLVLVYAGLIVYFKVYFTGYEDYPPGINHSVAVTFLIAYVGALCWLFWGT